MLSVYQVGKILVKSAAESIHCIQKPLAFCIDPTGKTAGMHFGGLFCMKSTERNESHVRASASEHPNLNRKEKT